MRPQRSVACKGECQSLRSEKNQLGAALRFLSRIHAVSVQNFGGEKRRALQQELYVPDTRPDLGDLFLGQFGEKLLFNVQSLTGEKIKII
jgi:hypothetical protein